MKIDMIPDYKCNSVYFSSWLKSDYPDIFNGLIRILNSYNVAYDIIPNTKDVWCRDYMPIQLDNERFFCYKYMPDYLTKNIVDREYITNSLDVSLKMNLKVKESSIIIDGGNVVKIGNKAIMTEKVFIENPNINKKSLKKLLEDYMEGEIIFIPWDRYEKYGHADGIIKPISENTILLTNYLDFDKVYTKKVIDRLSGYFEIEMLSYKTKKKTKESWGYINFLTIGNLIILPAFDKEEDEQALEQIKLYYPDSVVEQLNISKLIKDGGGLNCISWCRLISEDERRNLLSKNAMTFNSTKN